MRTRLPAILLGVTLIAVLLRFGGGHGMATTRCWAIAGIAATCALVAALLRKRQFVPDLTAIVVLTAVPVVIGLAQALPLGWHHPWLTPDLAVLGITRDCWSLDAQQTWRAIGFALAWGATAAVVAHLARHERAQLAAKWMVGLTSAHAAFAFIIAAFPDVWWNTPGNLGRLHGTFIYCNHAAAFWGMTIPLALILAQQLKSWPWWLATGVLASAVLFTGSRGGILVVTAITAPLVWSLLPVRRRSAWALGTVAALAGWLWLINPTVATSRFESLVQTDGSLSDQAETFSGRVLIWRDAAPLAIDAGAFGTGLGTVELVWPRAGSASFINIRMDHLHNDHLEWWLESGWLGALLLMLAGGFALVRTLRAPCSDATQRGIRTGAVTGIAILVAHGLVEFPWHNESVALHAALLVGLALATRDATERPHATWPLRIGLGLTALGLTACAWVLWPWAQQDERALDGMKYLTQRFQAGLAPDTGPVAEVTDSTPRTRRATIFAGHCVLDTRPLRPEPHQPITFDLINAWFRYLTKSAGRESTDYAWLSAALDTCAQTAPSDGTTWALRARLAARLRRFDQVGPAINRALAVAPTSPTIQLSALSVAESLSPDTATHVIDTLLAAGQPLPAWAWPLAARTLGNDDELAERIWQRRSPAMSHSALGWLAHHANLTAWLISLRQAAEKSPDLRRTPVSRWLVATQAFGDVCQPEIVLPRDGDQRAVLATRMVAAGLKIPPALMTALIEDGPISLLAATWDPGAPVRQDPPDGVSSQLYRPWLRSLWERHQFTQAILNDGKANTATGLPYDADGRLIAALANNPSIRPLVRRQATLIRERQQSAQWNQEDGYRWTWIQAQPGVSVLVDLDVWRAIVVDGEFFGWRRGRWDLGLTLAPGPHRIVIF